MCESEGSAPSLHLLTEHLRPACRRSSVSALPRQTALRDRKQSARNCAQRACGTRKPSTENRKMEYEYKARGFVYPLILRAVFDMCRHQCRNEDAALSDNSCSAPRVRTKIRFDRSMIVCSKGFLQSNRDKRRACRCDLQPRKIDPYQKAPNHRIAVFSVRQINKHDTPHGIGCHLHETGRQFFKHEAKQQNRREGCPRLRRAIAQCPIPALVAHRAAMIARSGNES